jgi:hypothetical protein
MSSTVSALTTIVAVVWARPVLLVVPAILVPAKDHLPRVPKGHELAVVTDHRAAAVISTQSTLLMRSRAHWLQRPQLPQLLLVSLQVWASTSLARARTSVFMLGPQVVAACCRRFSCPRYAGTVDRWAPMMVNPLQQSPRNKWNKGLGSPVWLVAYLTQSPNLFAALSLSGCRTGDVVLSSEDV